MSVLLRLDHGAEKRKGESGKRRNSVVEQEGTEKTEAAEKRKAEGGERKQTVNRGIRGARGRGGTTD